MRWILISIALFTTVGLVCGGACHNPLNDKLALKLGCNMDYQPLGGKYDDHLMVWSGNTDPVLLHRAIDAWVADTSPTAVRDSMIAANKR